MQYLLFVPLYRQIQRLLRYIETLLIIICICYTLFIVAVVCCCCYSRALHYKENGGALMGPGRRRGWCYVQKSRYNSYATLASLFLARIFIAVTWDFVYVTIAFCFTARFLHGHTHTHAGLFIYISFIFGFCYNFFFFFGSRNLCFSIVQELRHHLLFAPPLTHELWRWREAFQVLAGVN